MRSPTGPAAVTPTEIGQSKLPLRSRCASSIHQPRGNATRASACPPEASHAVWSSSSPTRGASAEAALPDGDAASALRVGTSAGTATLGSQPSPALSSSAVSFTDPVASGPHATPSSRTPQPGQKPHRHAGDPRQLRPACRAESQVIHPVHPSFHWLFLMAASCRHSSSAPSRRYAVLSSTIFLPSSSTDCSEPSA